MNLDIITKIFIPVLGAIITYMVVPFIMQKTSKEQTENIFELVKIAVFAAEQMHDAGLLKIPKKGYVLEYINGKGFDITEEDLNAMIEAAVKELNLEQMKLNKRIE